MSIEFHEVGIVVAKRTLKGPWADHDWLPVAVLPEPAPVAPWTPLGRDGDDERFYIGPATLAFRVVDTAHYRDNLLSDRPCVWVAIRKTLGDHPVELTGA